MGCGGLNRLLLNTSDLQSAKRAVLASTDARAEHIRGVLAGESDVVTLRVALENGYLHDSAEARILDNGCIEIELPDEERVQWDNKENVVFVMAMQRPKVMGRILEAAATLGVRGICVIGAEKVEKSYWQSKLFREDETSKDDENEVDVDDDKLPGRARPSTHIHDAHAYVSRRVDHVRHVRRRLQTGVEQGCVDAGIPWVILEPRGMESILDPSHEVHKLCPAFLSWPRLIAHPAKDKDEHASITETLTRVRGEGAVMAIGPEGGWTDEEIERHCGNRFHVVSIGRHVLRSETAAVVCLGLVHEGLRLSAKQGEENGVSEGGLVK